MDLNFVLDSWLIYANNRRDNMNKGKANPRWFTIPTPEGEETVQALSYTAAKETVLSLRAFEKKQKEQGKK